MKNLLWFIAASTLIIVAPSATASPAAPADMDSVRIKGAPRSLKDLRDQNLVRQAQDYSCAAAALATLLTFGLNHPVTEQEILKDLFAQLSAEDATGRRKTGFSLLDLQGVARQHGYKAEAFRLSAQDLPKLSGPVIVFIQPQGYKHFAVLRGVSGDRVFLADPSRGNVRMPAYQFLETWLGDDGTGVIFVVEPEKATAASAPNALSVMQGASTQPELVSARELLAIGAASSPTLGLNR